MAKTIVSCKGCGKKPIKDHYREMWICTNHLCPKMGLEQTQKDLNYSLL